MRYPTAKNTTEFEQLWKLGEVYDSWRSTYYHGGDDVNLKTGGDSDCGQPLYACADGKITSVEIKTTGFGKHLHLEISGSFGTRWLHYAHCSDILVKQGDLVKEGQVIAKLGTTGNSTACHLHFEVKKHPVGINAVANSKQELDDGWENPIAFIKKYLGAAPEPGEPMPTELQIYLGVDNDAAAKTKLKEHLGEFDGKCDWGNAAKDRGGHLGAARRRVTELETQPTPAPIDPTKWVANGLRVEETRGDTKTITNYERIG